MNVPPHRRVTELEVPLRSPPRNAPLQDYTFRGFGNWNCSVGIRNILAITNTLSYLSGLVGHAAERILHQTFPRFPKVDAVVALGDKYGIQATGTAWFSEGRFHLWNDLPDNRIMRREEVTSEVSASRQSSKLANGQTR
ncbi:MAG: UxaA family hydrolase, partial [Pseudomonadota bacterium]